MEINFKYNIGDIVYFCLDYLHIYKAKVYERYVTYKEVNNNKATVSILYTVLFHEDGELRYMCLPEESLHKTPDGLSLELE